LRAMSERGPDRRPADADRRDPLPSLLLVPLGSAQERRPPGEQRKRAQRQRPAPHPQAPPRPQTGFRPRRLARRPDARGHDLRLVLPAGHLARRRASRLAVPAWAPALYGGLGIWVSCTSERTSKTAPKPTRAYRTRGSENCVLIPIRNSTLARNTVTRTYLSDVSPAPEPSEKASVAWVSSAVASASPGCRYWGMYVGPLGALGLLSGWVARQASKATLNCGLKRRSASAIACLLPTVNAVNHASNVDESKLR